MIKVKNFKISFELEDGTKIEGVELDTEIGVRDVGYGSGIKDVAIRSPMLVAEVEDCLKD